MFRPQRERLRTQSFNRMIPNMLTMLALCAGLTALRFSIEGRFQPAVIALLVAAIFDSLDGRVARLLRQSSKFGAELDSLSDFLAFGIAPAVLLYLWALDTAGPVGWVLALAYSVCCALRLARFNTDLEEPRLPVWAKNYFTGVPSPAAAGLVLIPVILSFQTDLAFLREPAFVGLFMVAVAGLMVSRVPTYSFKSVRIQHRYALLAMLAVALFAALIVSAPWFTLSAILLAYLISLPFSWVNFHRQRRELGDAPPEE